MFTRKLTPKTPDNLQALQNHLIYEMHNHADPTSKEFASLAEQYVKVCSTAPKRENIDPNKLLAVAGNILVVAVVVGYEQKNVLMTKALSFIGKSTT